MPQLHGRQRSDYQRIAQGMRLVRTGGGGLMQPGEFVRHRARPEWGVGQVLLRTDDQIAVRFPHAVVRLKLAVAASHLEPVTATEADADHVGLTARRQGPAKTASGPRRLPRGEKARPPDPPDD